MQLPRWHDLALLLSRALGCLIQLDVCSADVVVRHRIPVPTVSRLVTITKLLSVCVFFIALLLFSFQNATTHIRGSLGATSGFVTILVIWCIINSWDSGSGDSEKDGVMDIISDDESHTT